MNTRIKRQSPELLSQKLNPGTDHIGFEKIIEDISPIQRYDASITMVISPEKTFKSRTFILINGSQPEVVDPQGIRWSKAFFNQDGTLFVDLGEKLR